MKKSFTENKNYNISASLLKRNHLIKENIDNFEIECLFDERKNIKITENPHIVIYHDKLLEMAHFQEDNFEAFTAKSFAKKLEFPFIAEITDRNGCILLVVVMNFVTDNQSDYDFEAFYFEEVDSKISYSIPYNKNHKSSIFPFKNTSYKQIYCFLQCGQIIVVAKNVKNFDLSVL